MHTNTCALSLSLSLLHTQSLSNHSEFINNAVRYFLQPSFLCLLHIVHPFYLYRSFIFFFFLQGSLLIIFVNCCCRIVSLCMSPINDSFMSGSLDHSVRIWDLRVNTCQVRFWFENTT